MYKLRVVSGLLMPELDLRRGIVLKNILSAVGTVELENLGSTGDSSADSLGSD